MVRKSDSDSALKKFFDENRSLKFLLPLLAVLIVVMIIVNLRGVKEKGTVSQVPSNTAGQIDTNQQQVEVLPQIIRSDSNDIDIKKDPFKEPMRLVGVVYSKSRPTAVVKWGSYSYIVEKEDFLGDSDWKVVEIDKNQITLESDTDRMVLSLDG